MKKKKEMERVRASAILCTRIYRVRATQIAIHSIHLCYSYFITAYRMQSNQVNSELASLPEMYGLSEFIVISETRL